MGHVSRSEQGHRRESTTEQPSISRIFHLRSWFNRGFCQRGMGNGFLRRRGVGRISFLSNSPIHLASGRSHSPTLFLRYLRRACLKTSPVRAPDLQRLSISAGACRPRALTRRVVEISQQARSRNQVVASLGGTGHRPVWAGNLPAQCSGEATHVAVASPPPPTLGGKLPPSTARLAVPPGFHRIVPAK